MRRLVAGDRDERVDEMMRATSGIASLRPNNLSAQLRFRFTPVGRGASFEIDDLYVDPLLTI